MEYALLMHNEANGLSMLQASGALYTMAVNVLLDRYPVEVAPEATGTDGGEDHRDIVCPVVGQAIAEATGLSPELKAGWQAKLLSVARQGLSGSMKGRLESLLASLRLLASEELQKPEVKRRIKCVNKVRNVLMHAGRLPGTLPGAKSREVAERYGVAIALGVFPDLVQVGLWKAMGLPSEGGPSLLQQTDNLRAFFLQGRARGWPLEDVAFEEWFESDAGYEQ